MKICFMSKYQGASDLWFLFYETIISMLSRGDVICKIERHVKKLTRYFTRLFLSIMTQCAINKKAEFLIGNCMKNQGKYKEAR